MILWNEYERYGEVFSSISTFQARGCPVPTSVGTQVSNAVALMLRDVPEVLQGLPDLRERVRLLLLHARLLWTKEMADLANHLKQTLSARSMAIQPDSNAPPHFQLGLGHAIRRAINRA